MKLFEYRKPFLHKFSDDFPITCAKFSAIKMEIYLAAERSIKVWDAKTGKPVRVLKNIVDSDISSFDLDSSHRKIVVGSH
jgi:WD40 repeat protein